MGIEAAIAAAIVSAGVGAATAASIAAFITTGAVSLVLGALASALSPKPKSPNLSNLDGFTAKAQGITQNIKQAISARRFVYGEARVGGALTFIETTDNDKFIHMILVLADHEIEEIGEIWFNDVSIPADHLDGSGNVITGDFSGKARIKKHLGSPTQVADTDLVSETSVTSAFRGRGVAYIYVRLEFDRDVYPSSIPNFTAHIKGKKILDPRDAGTRYTANGALISYDYLTSPLDALVPGAGVSTTDVDESFLNASANICDEMVTTSNLDDTMNNADDGTDIITLAGLNSRLQYQTGDQVILLDDGGGLPGGLVISTNYYIIPYQRKDTIRIKLATTLANALAGVAIDITSSGDGTIRKNAEPRYFGGGVLLTNESVAGNLEDILTIMAGDAIYVGGSWKLKAASFVTPVFTFDESHLASSIIVKTKHSRKDRFNLVKGVYVSPINDGEAADYPSITNSTYVTNDTRTIPIDLDLPMTQRPHTAMRMAKIKLERHRQEIFFEASFNLHAMQVQPGDVVNITNDRMGWSVKPFEVISWSLDNANQEGAPLFLVKMALQETDSSVYDWNSGEETVVDPALDTNLPNALVVNPPTTLNVTPIEVRTAGGDLTYDFLVDWIASSSIFVINGGYYEVQFKKTSETDWRTSFRAEDGDTEILVKLVEPGINYDTRVRAVSNIGVRSAYQSLFGFTVDSPSGATIVFDYRLITGSVVDITDFGALTDGGPDVLDFGSLVS